MTLVISWADPVSPELLKLGGGGHVFLLLRNLSDVVCFHRNHIAANWQTYSGMQDQYKQDGVERRSLKRIISHPDYNQMTFDYDIALLELSEPLKLTNTIQPICLPDSTHMFPAGMSCWVTGWGAMREGGIIFS